MSTVPWLWYSSFIVEEVPMVSSYVPHHSWIPALKVPENRVKYAFNYYKVCKNHPHNFAAYSYWIERCVNDGSDY